MSYRSILIMPDHTHLCHNPSNCQHGVVCGAWSAVQPWFDPFTFLSVCTYEVGVWFNNMDKVQSAAKSTASSTIFPNWISHTPGFDDGVRVSTVMVTMLNSSFTDRRLQATIHASFALICSYSGGITFWSTHVCYLLIIFELIVSSKK